MGVRAGIFCLMALLIFSSSCSGCVINNSIEASGGFYTESGRMDAGGEALHSDNAKIR